MSELQGRNIGGGGGGGYGVERHSEQYFSYTVAAKNIREQHFNYIHDQGRFLNNKSCMFI